MTFMRLPGTSAPLNVICPPFSEMNAPPEPTFSSMAAAVWARLASSSLQFTIPLPGFFAAGFFAAGLVAAFLAAVFLVVAMLLDPLIDLVGVRLTFYPARRSGCYRLMLGGFFGGALLTRL